MKKALALFALTGILASCNPWGYKNQAWEPHHDKKMHKGKGHH